jgi:hypothetical protein
MRRTRVFNALLTCSLLMGCGFRALSEQAVAGTYEATADWGRSALVLHSDHTFDQTVVRNDHTQATTKGTWKLDFVADKPASSGIIVLRPFLEVAHDHQGDLVGVAVPGIGRGFLSSISIAADPHFGISFEKK